MPYFAVRRQTILGRNYAPGDEIPTAIVGRLSDRVLKRQLSLGRIRFTERMSGPDRVQSPLPDAVEHGPDIPVLSEKRGSWYIFSNGMKAHGQQQLEKLCDKLGVHMDEILSGV